MFINFFVEKKFFSNTSKNMTEHLHSIKNSIKWKHELHYDPELSKCNFLWSRNQPVGQLFKQGWHKLHQQHSLNETHLVAVSGFIH